jgi:uncharacterized protein
VPLALQLLELLACPEDKGPLLYGTDGGAEILYNPRLSRVYEVKDGIPVLLVDEARTVEPGEKARLDALNLAPTFA